MHASSTLDHSETRTSAHIGIISAEGGWTVYNNNRVLYVTALIYMKCSIWPGVATATVNTALPSATSRCQVCAQLKKN
jgi:hypothetical protein